MIIGFSTWRGTGATTLATLAAFDLAARGERPWLVEADPAGGVLAARLDLALTPHTGLDRVAFPDAADANTSAPERMAAAAYDVGGVRVVPAPGDPFRAWACHVPRRPWAPVLRELDGPVLVDLGRLRGSAPVAPLLAQVAVLVMCATPDVVSLAATALWADIRGRVSPDAPALALDVTRVAVIDSPHTADATTRTDAEIELGERFAGWIPWSAPAVELVQRGVAWTDRRLRRQPLTSAVGELVERLRTWCPQEVAA